MARSKEAERRARLASTIQTLVSPLNYPTLTEWLREAMERYAALMETPTTILASPVVGAQSSVSSNDRLESGLCAWSRFEQGKLRFVERSMDENLVVIRPPAGKSVFTSPIVDRMTDGMYCKSQFFHEVLAPGGAQVTYGMRVTTDGVESLLGACTPRARVDPFADSTLGLLAAVVPAFAAGIETVARFRASRCSIMSLAESSEEGAIICDLASGRELYRNDAAREMLSLEPMAEAIESACGRIVRTLAGLALRAPSSASDPHGPISARVDGRRATYRLRTLYLAPAMFATSASALVFIRSSALPMPTEAMLRRRFRLTRREAQVAMRLLTGATDRDIGRALGVSEHTVGHHVESIFLKTDLHSRRTLVLRLMELATER